MAPPLAMGLALAFAGARARPLLEALYGIEAEIDRATRPGIEHGVAHAKLAWWRDETERLAGFVPVHPLTRALLGAAGRAPRYALLHERVTAAELRLAGFAPASEAELAALLERSHGALQSLAAEMLAGRQDPALAAFGTALGRGLGLVEVLDGPAPPLPAALGRARLVALAGAALTEARACLGADLAREQAHGLVRAALAEARLKRLAYAHAAPAALTQLWLAWRTARRARQGELP